MSALLREQCPADCWDWLTPNDVVRHALAAFYAACREVEASEGPWFHPEYGAWCSRAYFREQVTGLFRQRINVHGYDLGLRNPPDSSSRELPLPLVWDGHCLSVNDEYALELMADEARAAIEGCRGETPAVEAHGCAARAPATPASAVGPAPEIDPETGDAGSSRALHNLPADPLLLASKMQELPCLDNRANNPTSGENHNV